MAVRRFEASLSAILVLSGAAALVHETAWFRLLVPILGAGVAPAAAVSAGALLGLSVGAALGGRLADRSRSPALVLVLAEAAAALLCGLVPIALGSTSPVGGAVGAALLLALPAVPMGVSLPAALRALSPERDRVAPAFRRLYAWNTVGAVLGVCLAVALLLEAFGTRAAIVVACAMQAVAALGALVVARPPLIPREEGTPRLPPRTPRPLAAAAFLAGAAGLVLQVAWTRRLTPVVGNTTQVFAVVLGVQLIGLALGSLLLGPRRASRPRSVAVWLALAAAAFAALAPLAVATVADRVAEASARAAGDGLALLGISAAAAAALLLPAAALGAAILPWLLRAAWPDPDASGVSSGRLLAANTVGAAVGALATALAWLPAVGSAAALRGAAGLYVAAGAVAAVGWRRRPRALLAGLVTALLAQPFVAPISDAAGRDAIGAYYARGGAWAPDDALPVSFEEGRVSTVVVRDREGVLELWVDGSFEASALPTDLLHLGLLGHLPAALLAGRGVDAPRTSVIGLGAGFTSQALAAWRPRDLSVHELEPAVSRAAAAFARDGGDVPTTARVSFGDGRRGLERDPWPRDLVTSDPVHPAVVGSAWLYSLDHYRRVAAVLSDDGVACQWLPLYETVPDDLRLVVRTFTTVFPETYLFVAGYDGILVGARRPLRLSEARLRSALAGPARDRLAALGMESPGRLLGLLAMDPAGCRGFGGDGPLNTDDRLLLEFRAGRNRWSGDPPRNLRLVAAGRPDPASLLDAPASDAFVAEVAVARAFDGGLRAWAGGSWARAVSVFEERTAADPADVVSRRLLESSLAGAARAALDEGDPSEAARRARALLARSGVVPALRLSAVEVLRDAGLPGESRAAARDVLRSGPWPRAHRLAAD